VAKVASLLSILLGRGLHLLLVFHCNVFQPRKDLRAIRRSVLFGAFVPREIPEEYAAFHIRGTPESPIWLKLSNDTSLSGPLRAVLED
jgi:hypothetical protein